jgi:hypothetical protein
VKFRSDAMLSTKQIDRCNLKTWLPKNTLLQLFLSRFIHVPGGPGMDSNSFISNER